MLFYASKIIWFFLQPSSFLILLFASGFWAYRRGRTRIGIRILLITALIYGVAGLSPLGNAMMLGLEQQFTRPPMEELNAVTGIIVLGGVVDTLVTSTRDEIALNEGAERLTETAALAVRFPNARIVISGGDGALLYASMGEAGVAKRFFTRIGIDPGRILVEETSRTTSENAAFTKALVNPRPGERWLPVTPAFHIPRAIASLRGGRFRPHAVARRFPHPRPGGPAAIFSAPLGGLAAHRPGVQGMDGTAYLPAARQDRLGY